jgi:hypothetical protein
MKRLGLAGVKVIFSAGHSQNRQDTSLLVRAIPPCAEAIEVESIFGVFSGVKIEPVVI